MDWKRSSRRDLLAGGGVVLGMVGLVVLGAGSRAAQPTDTTAPAPVPVVAAGTVTGTAGTGVAARHRPSVVPEVAGWVRDAAARPEAGVTVEFLAVDGTARTVTTSPDGAFALVLPEGSYRVVCAVPGASCVTDTGTDTVLVAGPAALDLEVPGATRG